MARNNRLDPYRDLGPDDWWYPDTLPSESDLAPDQPPLIAEQVARFRNNGFLVVTGLWPGALIDRAVAAATVLLPPEKVVDQSLTASNYRSFSEMP